jgi:serine/threonine protein kinase
MASRFTIQQTISDHGTGVLARAVDERTGMPLVIRVFRCPSDEELVSLEGLMGVLAELRHPNIEPIHEIVREGTELTVVTEVPEGEPLSEILTAGPLSVDEFKVVAGQVMGALSAAHQKGAVHGSLNAARILVTRKPGQPWKALVTGYGMGFGDAEKTGDLSPYLCVPPEQWEQQPARRRSDVYAVGCVFYQALSGRSPFDGKTLKEVRHKHMKHDVRPLEQVAPQAPPWLCNWVMSLLTASPDERAAHATAALDAFRTAEASRNVITKSVPLPPPPGAHVVPNTGFVQVAGSAFFRVPNVTTQTVHPIDPMIQTKRHAAQNAGLSQRHQQAQPGKPLPPPGRAPRPEPAPAQKSNAAPWIIIGAGVLALAGVVAFFMGGHRETAPIKVAANPASPSSSAGKGAGAPGSNDLLPVTAAYPAGRQKPVNYARLVLHTMCDGGVMSTRMDADYKRQPANVDDAVFSWKDYAERGRDNTLAFPADQGTTYPKIVSLKPDATFPLSRQLRFVRFTGEGSPGAVLSTNAKNQARDFPFGPATPPSARGLTFAIVFFQQVKGYTQTLFNLSSQHGSAALRLGEKGELRFNGRQNGIPDSEQHATISINTDKYNPAEPLLVTGVWRAEPAGAQLRVRSASGYAFQTTPVKAPVPKDALGNLQIGREGLPGPTSTNKSTDAKSLRAFCGGIAELLIYSTGLSEADLKALEDQLAGYYFPPMKS